MKETKVWLDHYTHIDLPVSKPHYPGHEAMPFAFSPNMYSRSQRGFNNQDQKRPSNHHSQNPYHNGHQHGPMNGGPNSSLSSNQSTSSQSHSHQDEQTNRGRKRTRDELSQCDCDDIDMPLVKRINGLNIERNQTPVPDDKASNQMQMHDGQQSQSLDDQARNSFQENYPYAPSSEYYASNHLLYHLYLERLRRHEQQSDSQN